MIDFSQVTDIMLGNIPVEQVTDSLGNVLWSGTPVVLPNYFYMEDVSGTANTLSIVKENTNAPTIEVFVSTDTVNWSSMGNTSTTAITATIPANSKLYLKATASGWCNIQNYSNRITASGSHNVGGNIMSLLYNDNFENQTAIDVKAFRSLFYGNNKLVNANQLVLPATTLANNCYQQMFRDCTALITTPELPATTLAQYCYQYMFQGCTSLTTAPALPATTLTDNCYYQMFRGCSSLTTAPALPATRLRNSCYYGMFYSCSSLTTAPALPATTLAESCYNQMFQNCTALTTAPATLTATTMYISSCYQMFRNCTSLTTAPALPATRMEFYCYRGMFQGCTSLTTAPVLPATTLDEFCYYNMFNGCTSLNSVTTYADDISASNCLNNWLNGVAATGDFYNLGGATYTSGADGIPTGWTEHNSL